MISLPSLTSGCWNGRVLYGCKQTIVKPNDLKQSCFCLCIFNLSRAWWGWLINVPCGICWRESMRGWGTIQDGSLAWLTSRCWLSAESCTGTIGRGHQFFSMWDVPQATGFLQAWWLDSKSKCSKKHKMEAAIIYWSSSHRGQIQWQEREDP